MTKKKGKLKKIILGTIGVIILFILVVIVNLIVFEKESSVVSKGQPIENYNRSQSALLVLDIQEATTGESSLNPYYREESDALISKINLIIDAFKNKNSLVVYVRSEVSNPLINLINNSFAKGSSGAKFDKRLNLNSDIEIVKSRNDAFINTGLDHILTNNKINELYIVGLDVAYCINITSEAARNRNYKVNLIEDAVLSESEEMKDSMIRIFKKRGITILNIQKIISE